MRCRRWTRETRLPAGPRAVWPPRRSLRPTNHSTTRSTGLPAPGGPQRIDGVSLVPVLNNPRTRVRDHAFHAYPKRKLGRAIRTDRHRLVQWKPIGGEESSAEYELYDYQADPLETRNLAGEQPQVVRRLKTILDQYPDPVPRGGRRKRVSRQPSPDSAQSDLATPQIAGRPITVKATVRGDDLAGVVLAQGGREIGYALHFDRGRPVFDVRVAGKVTRLQSDSVVNGTVQLVAKLDGETMSLAVVDGDSVRRRSPGWIDRQPKDGLSLGRDDLSAAGDYESPHPLRGELVSYEISTVQPPARSNAESSHAEFSGATGEQPMTRPRARHRSPGRCRRSRSGRD